MPTSKKTAKSAYVLDDQIGFVLRLAVQFHTAIFTARMVEGLTQTQFATLSKVYEVGSCTQSDLGRLLTLDSATVNGVTDRMYSRGLIEITADLVDRRRQSISPRARQPSAQTHAAAHSETTAHTLHTPRCAQSPAQ